MGRLITAMGDALVPEAEQGILMRQILNTVARVAVSDLSVRIVGENGAGKEWLARIIHRMSARSDREFVHLDCSAVPFQNIQQEIFGSETIGLSRKEIRPGLLESSNGGTLYFDKISTLPFFVRQKLVAAFDRKHFRRDGGREEVHFNVRAIEGMNMPPDEGHLRSDAGGRSSPRLGQVTINLPPLRERRDEIPSLVGRFIDECNARGESALEGMTAEALSLCSVHDWPGNIQELRNAVEYAAVLCQGGFIGRDHLPAALRRRSSDDAETRPQGAGEQVGVTV